MAAVEGLSIAGVLAAVLLLLCIPVSFTAAYRTGEPPEAYLRWLFFTIDLTKEPKERGAKRKKPPKPREEKPKAAKKPLEFSELLGVVVDLLSSLRGGAGMLVRNFVFYRIHLYMVVAGEDAADTAMAYGRVNAVVYTAYALALGFLRIEKPDIQIRPDFTAEEGKVDFASRARLTPLVALGAAIRIGCAFLVKTMRRKHAQEPPAPEKGAQGKTGD